MPRLLTAPYGDFIKEKDFLIFVRTAVPPATPAAEVRFQHRIGGASAESADKSTFETENPTTGAFGDNSPSGGRPMSTAR